MKVLYFTNSPSPYRVEFFNQLNRLCDLTVVYNSKTEKDRNKKWYYENEYKFKTYILSKYNILKINKILKNDYDIIIIGVYTSIIAVIAQLLLKVKRRKYILNADGGFINYNDNIIEKKLKTFFISNASFYLSSGKETNKYLSYYGAKKENIYVYPFSSLSKDDIIYKPLTKKEKNKLRDKYNFNYNKRIFVSIGNFIERKGYDLLLKCIKENKYENSQFIIIGGGQLKTKYEQYIKENKIENVLLVDFMKKDVLFEYLKLSDIFIFPTREDIWGLVINEAMANGLPIISSNRCLSALEFKLDAIYEPENLEQLNNLILKYENLSEEKIEEIGKKNIRKIKNYTIENMCIKTYDILKKLLKEVIR